MCCVVMRWLIKPIARWDQWPIDRIVSAPDVRCEHCHPFNEEKRRQTKKKREWKMNTKHLQSLTILSNNLWKIKMENINSLSITAQMFVCIYTINGNQVIRYFPMNTKRQCFARQLKCYEHIYYILINGTNRVGYIIVLLLLFVPENFRNELNYD